MNTFRVQKIRSCVQCGAVLSLKCKGCVSHPDRKPKVVVLYDWPKILQTCPSGHCIRIACQRPGCGNENVWRLLKMAKGGKSIYAESFCSRQCNILVRAIDKTTRVMVRCSWDVCKTMVPRTPSEMKKLKRAFCRPDHYFLALRKESHDAREAARVALDSLALLSCEGKCRGQITEHSVSGVRGVCRPCGTVRSAGVSVRN